MFMLVLALAAASLSVPHGTADPDPSIPKKYELKDLQLTFDTEGLTDVKGDLVDGDWIRGQWTAKFGGSKVEFLLGVLDRGEFDFDDAADVVDTIAYNRGNDAREEGMTFRFEDARPIPGNFGELPYGWFARDDRYDGTLIAGQDLVVTGVTPKHGYMLELTAEPALGPAEIDAFIAWAQGAFAYTGPAADPSWTKEEAEARWKKSAPDAVVKKKHLIVRTKYYIIFTDIGKGTVKAFAKAVDANHEQVRSVFPFESVEGQRLMPIFYFTNRDHYLDWWVKNLGGTREKASRSGGVASGDVYSTYHQSVKASVHIHEQTHQIFRNRLRWGGGGSWFQEGVADYMSSKPAELNEIKRLAKKGELVPFEEFMVMPSLLMSSSTEGRKTGGSAAGLAYTYAASIVEFCKHSKFGGEKFLLWCEAMGNVARGDLPAIKKETSRIYGATIEEFEAAYTEYWSKRKPPKKWHEPAPSKDGKKSKRRR